jgi:hypothetical protein
LKRTRHTPEQLIARGKTVAQRLPRHVNGVAAADSCGAKETAAVIKTNSLTGDQVSGERAADESGGVVGGQTWQLYPLG